MSLIGQGRFPGRHPRPASRRTAFTQTKFTPQASVRISLAISHSTLPPAREMTNLRPIEKVGGVAVIGLPHNPVANRFHEPELYGHPRVGRPAALTQHLQTFNQGRERFAVARPVPPWREGALDIVTEVNLRSFDFHKVGQPSFIRRQGVGFWRSLSSEVLAPLPHLGLLRPGLARHDLQDARPVGDHDSGK